MLLLLGAGLLFTSLVVAFSIVGVLTSERRAIARSVAAVQAIHSAPSVMTAELERPFTERVIAPLGGRLVGVGRKITRADTATKIAHRLDIAGNPPAWDVNRIIGLKVLGLGALGVLGFLFSLSRDYSIDRVLLFTAGFAAFGYVLPNVLLKNAGDKRETLMRNSLPDAIDLLTISVEAGLGFDAAVARVAKNTTGPLAQEFSRLLQEMQLGIGRSQAMRAMGERTSLADLKSFCLAMVQADSLGIPIARVLRIQSHEMRTKRRQRAEEAAQKVPVKILFPVIFFILPVIFIVVIGPVFLGMGDLFG
ncbi:type II secretion system F family protein [Nocardioides sp.]|uniref:type II secretion system F family protein n=1 Tax=Nocardioides sp. TaxID=35761 RepID=UPI0026237894|nr:type II secretion system F family protein [Nocardioides sp.]MCW2736407.1 Tight adherence protein [Nocardioides sp.]